MAEYLQDMSWRVLIWLMRLHAKWDKRSTLTITTTRTTTEAQNG